MPQFIGLDVHKRVVEACAVDERGEVLFRERFAATRNTIEEFARRRIGRSDKVALEATTNTWPIAKLLEPFAAEVVISNPLRTKAIAEAKVKTDKVDAEVLAQLLRCDFLPKVWMPDAGTRDLRRVTHRRASLVSDRTALKNRIHAVLHERLIPIPAGVKLFGTKGRAWLRAIPLDPIGRASIDADLRLLEAIEAESAPIDQLLVNAGAQDPRVKLLLTLPGVDVSVAQTLLAALGDVRRFKSGDHAASYLGLTPSTKQSGDPEKRYHGPITKAGSGHARWMLVQAAQHLDKHPGPLGAFFRRILRKKNRNVAVVATARKLVVIAWHMLTKNEPYRYAQPRPTEAKLAKLRLRSGGERRVGGPPKGIKAPAKLPGGSRTVKALDDVYAFENLPPRGELPPGERAMLKRLKVTRFVRALEREHVVPRAKGVTDEEE